MPTLSQFDDSIQRPRGRIKDQTLKNGRVEMAETQLANQQVLRSPFKASGSYAVVYKYMLLDGDGQPAKLRAIRCWFNPAKVDGDRLIRLQDYLEEMTTRITIDFRFLQEGIRTEQDGPYLPILDMEWVEGLELREQVANLVEAEDAPGLRALADAWLALVAQMRAAHIAHGDLSGANIMVRPDGVLRLVDYDSMYIPPFQGELHEVVGVPGYQRPDEKRSYDEEMDRFSALLIYVALCAVADSPPLWRAHTTYSATNPDKLESDQLLFQVDDLAHPDSSALFHDLETRCSARTQQLARALHAACRSPLDQCPDVVELADPAYQAKRAHAALQQAILSGDDAEIVRCADDPALVGYAPAGNYRTVDQARERLRRVEALKLAIAQQDDALIIRLWPEVKTALAAAPYQADFERALKRNASIERLRAAIAADDIAQTLLLAQELQGAAALGGFQREIARAAAIQRRREQMANALAAHDDERVFAVWNDMVSGYNGTADPQLDQFDQPAQAARTRMANLPQLAQAALAENDAELDRLAPLFLGYPIAQPYAEQLRRATERVQTLPEIERSLREGDDLQALSLWDRHAFANKPIGVRLRSQIDAARAHWIDQVDPKGGLAEIRDRTLTVRWRWPDGISLVAVAVRTDTFASRPTPEDRYIAREVYEAQGGFVARVEPATTYYIRLFSFFHTATSQLLSPGLHPEASIQLSGGLTVYYSGGPQRTELDEHLYVLRIRTSDGRPLPALRVLARQGQRVLNEHARDCLSLYQVDPREQGAREGCVDVRISRADLPPGPHFVRVFPMRPDGGLLLVGQPENNLLIS